MTVSMQSMVERATKRHTSATTPGRDLLFQTTFIPPLLRVYTSTAVYSHSLTHSQNYYPQLSTVRYPLPPLPCSPKSPLPTYHSPTLTQSSSTTQTCPPTPSNPPPAPKPTPSSNKPPPNPPPPSNPPPKPTPPQPTSSPAETRKAHL